MQWVNITQSSSDKELGKKRCQHINQGALHNESGRKFYHKNPVSVLISATRMSQPVIRLILFLLLGSAVWAHANHGHPSPRGLAALRRCDETLIKRGHEERAAQRREKRAKHLRRQIGLAEGILKQMFLQRGIPA